MKKIDEAEAKKFFAMNFKFSKPRKSFLMRISKQLPVLSVTKFSPGYYEILISK